MPLYEFECPTCGHKERHLPLAERGVPQTCDCGESLERVFSIPFPPVMRLTADEMTLNSINSKETSHMKPSAKQMAVAGLGRPLKTIY